MNTRQFIGNTALAAIGLSLTDFLLPKAVGESSKKETVADLLRATSIEHSAVTSHGKKKIGLELSLQSGIDALILRVLRDFHVGVVSSLKSHAKFIEDNYPQTTPVTVKSKLAGEKRLGSCRVSDIKIQDLVKTYHEHPRGFKLKGFTLTLSLSGKKPDRAIIECKFSQNEKTITLDYGISDGDGVLVPVWSIHHLMKLRHIVSVLTDNKPLLHKM